MVKNILELEPRCYGTNEYAGYSNSQIFIYFCPRILLNSIFSSVKSIYSLLDLVFLFRERMHEVHCLGFDVAKCKLQF